MRLMVSAVALSSVILVGCQPGPQLPPNVQIVVSVEADPGVFLSDIPVRVDGKPVGHSDPNGLLLINLRA